MKCAFSVIVLAVVTVLSAPAPAADYPSKSITMIAGSGAGGAVDTLARIFARHMEKDWGQQVVVHNKAGAGGSIGAQQIKSEPPDGHAIMVINSAALATSWQIIDPAPYTVDDFTYISTVAGATCGWVVKGDSPYKTWKDIVSAAKAGKSVSFGAYSPDNRLVLSYVAKQEGINFKIVNFKSTTEIITAVLGGHVDFGFTGGNHVQHVKKGTMRAVAAVDDKRLPDSPDVPTLQELGYDVNECAFFVVAGPKGMPDPVVTKIADLVARISNSDESPGISKPASRRLTYWVPPM